MNNYFCHHNYPYYFIRRGSISDFLSTDTFWVAIGSVATAIALIYAILKNKFDQKQSIKNIKHAMYFELITNIKMLFSGEVERRPLFDINQLLRKDFIRYISDQELFSKFQTLYSELDYYQTFVQNVYLNSNIPNSGTVVTEKQLSTMNKFLDYFGIRGIVRSRNETWDQARDRAITEKNKHFKKWMDKLSQDIERMF